MVEARVDRATVGGRLRWVIVVSILEGWKIYQLCGVALLIVEKNL